MKAEIMEEFPASLLFLTVYLYIYGKRNIIQKEKEIREAIELMKDLTSGKPRNVLWAFSIPMLISVMFQQIYNIADSMIAGKFAGEDALAAVGASYPITMIFMAIAMGSNVGCSVIISQLFGGRKFKEMKTAITTTFTASAVLSLVLTILGLVFCHPLMRLIQTPDNIFGDAALYLNIYIVGLAFLFLYNICTGIFNALGDSKTPLYFLIGSSIGNIILDLVFVINFKMGVAGVAWATFIAQGICPFRFYSAEKNKRDSDSRTSPAFFRENAGEDCVCGGSQYLTAEFCVGRKHVCAGAGKQLRVCDYCRIFSSNQAEHLLYNLRHNPV